MNLTSGLAADGSVDQASLFAVIPAAGVGTRMAALSKGHMPKQFLHLGGQTILEHSVKALASNPRIHGVAVVVSDQDEQSAIVLRSVCDLYDKVKVIPQGGATRAETVKAGLGYWIAQGVDQEAWVLVHDAARPGLSQEALSRLIDGCFSSNTGGILAMPVADTVKKSKPSSSENRSESSLPVGPAVEHTLPRETLWLAQTPQMFRLFRLYEALKKAEQNHLIVTDEASAIEAQGDFVRLIEGERRNLKVTVPEDLEALRAYFN